MTRTFLHPKRKEKLQMNKMRIEVQNRKSEGTCKASDLLDLYRFFTFSEQAQEVAYILCNI